MADRYLLETSAVDGYQLEDGSGVLLLDDGYIVRNFYTFHQFASSFTVDAPNFTAEAGDTLICVITYVDPFIVNVTLQDIVGSNDTWVECETGIYASDNYGIRVFYLPSATAGSCTIRATSDNSTGMCISVIPVAKLLTTSVYEDSEFLLQTTPGTSADAIGTNNFGTLTTQPQMILGITFVAVGNGFRAGETPDIGSGFTSIGVGMNSEGSNVINHMRIEHKRVTATTATKASFTCPTAGGTYDYISATVAFREFVTAASVTNVPMAVMPPYVPA